MTESRRSDRTRDRRDQPSRRELLQSAGFLLTASAFPGRVMGLALQSDPAAMARLIGYLAQAKTRDLPPDVLTKAKYHVLDTLAAMVSGSRLKAGQAAIRFADTYGSSGTSTVVATKVKAGTIEAALVNGLLAHSDETDDSHDAVRWHPGCAVVPAALAVGERFSASGAHLLRAVALGYDIGSRVMATMIAAGPQTHKSTHSIAGVWGAAAASGSLAGLTEPQMRWLLDYTAQQSSGIGVWSRDVDHIEKGFAFGGMPARSGVTSALLVQSGWTGVDDVFTGEDNFLIANAPAADPQRLPTELLVEQLGQRYELMRTNIKKWSVGSPIQAPLDALSRMLKARPFEADHVKEVVVTIEASDRYVGTAGPASVVDDREMPDVNIQYMLAVMMIDKTASFQAAHDKARMTDPAVLRQRAKVRLGSGSGRQPLLRVTLADGTELTEAAEPVRGTIRNPMTSDEILAKCRDLITPVLGSGPCTKLLQTVLDLERVDNVRTLSPLLQKH
jgi:2-methylcitrate dehydratase PrpD